MKGDEILGLYLESQFSPFIIFFKDLSWSYLAIKNINPKCLHSVMHKNSLAATYCLGYNKYTLYIKSIIPEYFKSQWKENLDTNDETIFEDFSWNGIKSALH